MIKHQTVLLNESINRLKIKPNGFYLDGTFGSGGHSRLILSKLNKFGKLFSIDRDPESIPIAESIKDPRFHFSKRKFSTISEYLSKKKLLGKIDGMILDLGVSYSQIKNPKRGFSFVNDGPLDMRMDNQSGRSAADWLLEAKEQEIYSVLKKFGEERFSKKIAKSIFERNKKNPITRTNELTNLILNSIPFRERYKHPARRTFQAIRIFINNELEEIKKILNDVIEILSPTGRLSIISFHSLEDRLVKDFLLQREKKMQVLKRIPITEKEKNLIYLKIFKNVGKMRPSPEEIKRNPRSRSAILRFAEKIR